MKNSLLFSFFITITLMCHGISWASEYKSSVFIQNYDLNLLGIDKATPTVVETYDQVKGGCWTNMQQVKTEIEFVLTSSGFNISDEDEPDFKNYMSFFALGYRTKSGLCVVSYRLVFSTVDFQERAYSGHQVQNLRIVKIWQIDGILSGPDSANGQLRDSATNLAKKFVVDLRKSRTQIISAIEEETRENNLPEATRFWEKFE